MRQWLLILVALIFGVDTPLMLVAVYLGPAALISIAAGSVAAILWYAWREAKKRPL